MSYIEYSEDEIADTRNDLFISDFTTNENNYLPLKYFGNEKIINEESNMEKIIKNQFKKEMLNKRIISDEMSSLDSFESANHEELSDSGNFKNIISYSDEEKQYQWNDYNHRCITNFDNNNNDNNYQFSFNLNSNLSFSSENFDDDNIYLSKNEKNLENKNNKKKIFKVVKVQRIKKEKKFLSKKRKSEGKSKRKYNDNDDIDWENIPVPKEKHLHLDRKKKRIVFQRMHLKFIYSIVNLEYPFNFKVLFNLIKEHVGDKTLDNYGTGKSFHIIKVNGEFIIVTFKEKKLLLKQMKKKK